jgi:periplasmic protein TonB
MIAKKFTKTDFENKSLIFRQIGAIIVLSLVFLAFEYKTDEINSMTAVQKWFNNSPVDNIPMMSKTPPAPPEPTVDFVKPMQVSDLETPTHGFEMDANTHESAN